MSTKGYLYKKIYISVGILVILTSLFILGCCCEDGKQGPPGPQGPPGLQGPAGSSQVITVPDDIESIHEAIDALPLPGGTIYIKAKTYTLTQGVYINRSNVTIVGEKGTVVKLGDHVNEPVFLIGTDEETPTKRIDNIRIANIEINGNKLFQDSETDPNRPWIRNNGIDVRMVDNIWISDIDVHDARSGGIVVSWDSQRIIIENSYFHNNYFDGIALYDSKNIQVSNFMCYENNSAGLSLDNNLREVQFNNGTIQNNGDVGIFARYSEDINFHSLMILNNQNHGCFISHESIGTNTGVTRLFFNSCLFLDNIGYGYYLDSPVSESPYNTVIGCLFSGNTMGAIYLHPDGEINQEANVCQPLKSNIHYYYFVNSGGFLAPDQIKYSRMTHLSHCFVYLAQDCSLNGVDDLFSTIQVINYAHNRGVKVLLGFGGATGNSTCILDPNIRERIIKNLISLVVQYGYDGVDVDLESFSGEDMKQAFIAFSQELCDALDSIDPNLIMKASVPSSDYYGQWFDWDAVKDCYDMWLCMTYDMSGDWDLLSYHHTAMKLDSNLNLWSQSIEGAVNYWIGRGVPPEKLHIGLAFYGYLWKGVDDIGQDTNQVTSFTSHSYQEILQMMCHREGTLKWDPIAKCPYYVGSTIDKFLITYDNEESIRIKCEYVVNKGLAGVGIWQLSHDYNPATIEKFPLGRVVYDVLKDCL